jgi:hypothetical protein
MASRICAASGCTKVIAGSARQKFHSDTCRNRESKRRHRAKVSTEVIDPKRIKRGDAYATLEDSPELVVALSEKNITQRTAAAAIGISESMFSEAYATFLAHRATIEEAKDWKMEQKMVQMLSLAPCNYDAGTMALTEWLDRAVGGFVSFRHAYFSTARGPYYTKDFHRAWIRSILGAIVTGGRYLILSPPRHGKSELLVHFAVWLIGRDPNIKILWIGGNGDIASDMVGAVKQYLESSPELMAEVLGPGAQWAPAGRQSTAWGTTKLTVASRTVVQKAPTIRSVGRGGKILSMDVDLIICDDIEDYDSTENETSRGKTRSWWFNNVESRKEDHTAWVTIGSRQHPDDLYDYLLGDKEWSATVDTAHRADCSVDPHSDESHIECMLFPELRSYTWLMSKKATAEAQGLLANYEMVYLNDPRPVGMSVFSLEGIERSKNFERGLGLSGLSGELGYHLVGGLDPSATGFQASFLWAYVKTENKLYAIDIDNRQGGGIYNFGEMMTRWDDQYGLKHWVWENNIMREPDLLRNPDIRAILDTRDIYLEPLNTQGGNKNNPIYGVGAMSHLYDSGLVDLPWGTEEAREKMTTYIRQMVRFVDGAGAMRRSNRKTDVLMASWFPMKVIRRFQKETQAQASLVDEFSFTGFEATDWSEVPW